MINEVIAALNERIKQLFGNYPDAKIYGLTQSVIRKTGTVVETLPCVVDKDGEGTYVGIDDVAPIILYHKNNSVTSAQTAANGVGDAAGDIITTFNNSAIVYMDRKRVKSAPDEMAFYLQAVLGGIRTAFKPFKNIRVLFQGVILNSGQVYAGEYQSTEIVGLDPGKSMLSLNYQIQVTYLGNCFSDCLF